MTSTKMLSATAAIGATLLLAACGSSSSSTSTTAASSNAAATGSATTGSSKSPSNTKVALMMGESVNSPGFGVSFLPAVTALKKQFGSNFTLADNVPAAQYESTTTQLAQRGYDLILFDSATFTEVAQRVAPKYPKTQFAVVNGGVGTAPNLSSFPINWIQAGYLTGIAAAYSTKSNKIGSISGTIGGVKLPPIVSLNDGFTQAVKAFNPAAKVTITYTQSFSDPAGSATAAQAQYGQGIDVIWADTDAGDSGIFKTATRLNKKVIGYGSDESSLAPNNTITSTLVNYSGIVQLAVKQYLDGTLQPKVNTLDIDTHTFGLAPIKNVDAATAAKINDTVSKVTSGALPLPTG